MESRIDLSNYTYCSSPHSELINVGVFLSQLDKSNVNTHGKELSYFHPMPRASSLGGLSVSGLIPYEISRFEKPLDELSKEENPA